MELIYLDKEAQQYNKEMLHVNLDLKPNPLFLKLSVLWKERKAFKVLSDAFGVYFLLRLKYYSSSQVSFQYKSSFP